MNNDDLGEGYRKLSDGETIQIGDEVFTHGEWTKFYPHTAGSALCPGLIARRRVSSEFIGGPA